MKGKRMTQWSYPMNLSGIAFLFSIYWSMDTGKAVEFVQEFIDREYPDPVVRSGKGFAIFISGRKATVVSAMNHRIEFTRHSPGVLNVKINRPHVSTVKAVKNFLSK